jgi:hypothetical protein
MLARDVNDDARCLAVRSSLVFRKRARSYRGFVYRNCATDAENQPSYGVIPVYPVLITFSI